MVQSSIFSALFKLQNYLKMLYDSHIIMYSAFCVLRSALRVACSVFRVACFVFRVVDDWVVQNFGDTFFFVV